MIFDSDDEQSPTKFVPTKDKNKLSEIIMQESPFLRKKQNQHQPSEIQIKPRNLSINELTKHRKS